MNQKDQIERALADMFQAIHDEGINRIQLLCKESRPIIDDSAADLVMVDGAMACVGGNERLGTAYELRFNIWKGSEHYKKGGK